jgi:phosphomannomutase
VVDDKGQAIDSQLLLLIVTDLFLQTHKSSRIAVPVEASGGVEEIAAKYGVDGSKLSQVRGRFEQWVRQSISVPCPWSKKGTVMRRLIEESESKNRQLIDGVRVIEDGGWVLVSPDRATAAFNILAESQSSQNTSQLLEKYRTLVADSQNS